MPLEFPHIPGFEAAGVVEQAPAGSEFKVGDEVWGNVRRAYAEYVVSKGVTLVPKPGNVSFVEACALVVAGSTAYEGLIERLKLQPGETVLVTAAAGGVGNVAVQIAVATGARVFGVASAINHDFVRSLGASEVFDYHDTDWPQMVRKVVPDGVDVLFDAIGSETGQAALKAMRDGGRASFIAYPPPDLATEGRGITGEFFSTDAPHERFVALNKLIEAGKLKGHVTETLPLEEAAEALRKNQQGHTRGKIVLTI